jgi:hypothetical protein
MFPVENVKIINNYLRGKQVKLQNYSSGKILIWQLRISLATRSADICQRGGSHQLLHLYSISDTINLGSTRNKMCYFGIEIIMLQTKEKVHIRNAEGLYLLLVGWD